MTLTKHIGEDGNNAIEDIRLWRFHLGLIVCHMPDGRLATSCTLQGAKGCSSDGDLFTLARMWLTAHICARSFRELASVSWHMATANRKSRKLTRDHVAHTFFTCQLHFLEQERLYVASKTLSTQI